MPEADTVAQRITQRTYKPAEVAAMLGMSTRWVQTQAMLGHIPSVRIGNRLLFLRDVIDTMVPARAAAPVKLQPGAQPR